MDIGTLHASCVGMNKAAHMASSARAVQGVKRLVKPGQKGTQSAEVRHVLGSRREPPALKLDAVELASTTRAAGVFGIGLQVGNDTHHKVLRVGNLQDTAGRAVTTVSLGDQLTHVDGRSTRVDGLQIGEDMILGEEGTVVHLRFRSGATGKEFEVMARRHVPVRSWEQVTKRYVVRQDLVGQELMVEPYLVQALDNVRRLVADEAGSVIDLMGPGSLGLVLGRDRDDKTVRPLQVVDVVPCGPADLSRRIEIGDDIVRSPVFLRCRCESAERIYHQT